MRVLFVNHTAIESGAEMSLLDLIQGMPDTVSARVACPEGDLASTLRNRGVQVDVIAPIEASFRFHLLRTARGLAQLLRAALAIRRAARRHRADIVHANSVRAGLAATIAGVAGGPPVVVHVRDCLPAGAATDTMRRFLARRAAKVLANSTYTATTFTRGSRESKVEVVYSPVDLERFDPARVDRARARARLGVGQQPALAVIGQITPWKGHATAIEAVALLKRRMPHVRLLVVGTVKFAGAATRYDNLGYLRSLEAMVGELGLEENVDFVGERSDVPDVLRAIDVLLLPSSEEPFGRVVVEAMAMETPVIATRVGGPAEVIEDGVNGRLVAPGDPAAWAGAVEELMAADDLRLQMGLKGRATAMRFDRGHHVARVMDAYRDVLDGRAT